MRRAGTVVGTAQSLVVVRSDDDEVPDLGGTVIDADLDDVGTIVDVFGPVGRPYVAVSPDVENTASLVGSAVYARDD